MALHQLASFIDVISVVDSIDSFADLVEVVDAFSPEVSFRDSFEVAVFVFIPLMALVSFANVKSVAEPSDSFVDLVDMFSPWVGFPLRFEIDLFDSFPTFQVKLVWGSVDFSFLTPLFVTVAVRNKRKT